MLSTHYGALVPEVEVLGDECSPAETFAMGAFPERGLTAENSFL